MLALFVALSVALLLVSWAELVPAIAARRRAEDDKKVTPVPPLQRLSTGQRETEADPGRVAPAPAPMAPSGQDEDAVMERLAALLAEGPEPGPAAAAPVAHAVAPAPAAAPARRPAQPTPAPEPVCATPELDAELPRITGYRPGDVIELELEGPAPRGEDIRFEQSGKDTRVVIEGFPALILARAQARSLTPAIFRFRSPQLA